MKDSIRVSALVPSAGRGIRFGGDKIFSILCGKPVLIHTLETLSNSDKIKEIIVITKEESIRQVSELISLFNIKKVSAILQGGKQRQDSVFNGLRYIQSNPDYVLIHDGVRPLVSNVIISNAVNSLTEANYDGVVVGLPMRDTIKRVITGEYTTVRETPNREEFWSVQTPQVFHYKTLLAFYERAYEEGFYSTDDSAIIERYGGKVRLILGESRNIKITSPEDMIIAERYILGIKQDD